MEARSLDNLAVVMMLLYFLRAVAVVRMRAAYASVFCIFRADADGAGFSTKIPFRSAYRMACCIYFPAYTG